MRTYDMFFCGEIRNNSIIVLFGNGLFRAMDKNCIFYI